CPKRGYFACGFREGRCEADAFRLALDLPCWALEEALASPQSSLAGRGPGAHACDRGVVRDHQSYTVRRQLRICRCQQSVYETSGRGYTRGSGRCVKAQFEHDLRLLRALAGLFSGSFHVEHRSTSKGQLEESTGDPRVEGWPGRTPRMIMSGSSRGRARGARHARRLMGGAPAPWIDCAGRNVACSRNAWEGRSAGCRG